MLLESIITADACLVKSGPLSDVLAQLFPNLQRLTDQEGPDVLRTLVNKFPWEAALPASESSVRKDERANPWSKANKNSHDGREPLLHPGHEATAQFMSSLKSEREFKTVAELAKHAGVTRKTVYLWMKDPDVLRRAKYLTAHRREQGALIGRVRWPRIMLAMSNQAEAGDTAAANFVRKESWPEELGSGITAQEMFEESFTEANIVLPYDPLVGDIDPV